MIQSDSPILKSNNKIILKITLVVFLIFIIGFSTYFLYLQKGKKSTQLTTDKTDQTINESESPQQLICDRTSRLENNPNIDRALSLIYQRLTEYGTDKKLFPPQLINCIKVKIENIKNEDGSEGYFDPNDTDIKPNYFPITIDSNSNFFADDLSTAILLVHEITHVQQFIDSYNANIDTKLPDIIRYAFNVNTKSDCLTHEVFAFNKQLIFTLKLNDEEEKSINYRIENDKNLHPQLKILKTLKDSFKNFNHGCEEYDVDCIERAINMHIYSLLRDSGVYDKQCSAYSGTYIGE
ncbi:MAG: hypothetical protein WC895_02195 [Candidatus Shapirobacteria bacterium]|jgi:hypothetical protein